MQEEIGLLVAMKRLLRGSRAQLFVPRNANVTLDPPITALEVFKKAGEATAILSALFYVVGWSSTEAYYAAFGLNLAQLPISALDGPRLP